jgi:DNA-binding MarR family transcriptional regulator
MKRKSSSPESRIDASGLWSLNYRLVAAVIASMLPGLSALDLEIKELFVLGAIDEHPHPAELAQTLCMPKPSVTVYLKRLEREGFVRREIDPGDLRRHRLSVTPAGRKIMAQGFALLSRAFEARLSRLSTAEQAQLVELLQKLN